jgi:hypothetical protein
MQEMREIASWRLNLTMVYQYKYAYKEDRRKGPSLYSHYNHGQDGIVWDCIQLVGLAKSKILLTDHLPTWTMEVNGNEVSRAEVDNSYVVFINEWLNGREKQLPCTILDAHLKAEQLTKRVVYDGPNQYLDWNPSKDKLD